MSDSAGSPAEQATPEDWKTTDILRAPMDVAWQFDYAIEQEKLENLYRKAKQRQWDGEQRLDWSVEIDPSKPIIDERQNEFQKLSFFKKLSKSQQERFTAHATCQLLSQFLHGEQGALMTAAAVTHAVPDYEAKLYAASQTMDEARHVEVYERYINKLAMAYPISPWLKNVIDATLQADHYAKVMVGMNMVVEGLALAAFHNMSKQTTCPLLKDLTDMVLQDESRHVAFGNLYLQRTISDMHPDDREDVAQFAFEAIKAMADSMGGYDGKGPREYDPGFAMLLENCEVDLADFLKSLAEADMEGLDAELPPGQIHSFRDLMMPALVRVGAVTERTKEMYRAAGIPVVSDTRILESMEDPETGDLSA
ncbi:MAG: ferritin-like domain-containing protein [Myxococcota bacterium]|nr:ferritin-like domain-containing protein [Myxococcota bacterium]